MPRHRFADTKDRIERAAIALFVEKGVAETTVRDIAQAVDISEGALYRHFVGKDELVWQLFERHYVAFAGRLQALADGEPAARGKLAAMIRGFLQAHDDDPTLFHFLLFVQHGQLSKLARRRADAGDGDAWGARVRQSPPVKFRRRTPTSRRALGDGPGAAADDVCRLRPAAAGAGCRTAIGSWPPCGPR